MQDNSEYNTLDLGLPPSDLALTKAQESRESQELPPAPLYTGPTQVDSKENQDIKNDTKDESCVSSSGKDEPDTVSTLIVKDIEEQLPIMTEPNLPLFKLVPLMIGLCAGMLLSSTDAVNFEVFDNALPRIISGFNQLDKIGWINVVYGMTTASFIPLYGAFSNVFGKKISLMIAIIIYEIGQIITGAAAGPNAVIQMIIGRAIAGVGNGGIITLLFVVVTDIVPKRDVPRYQGIINAIWGISAIVGPVLSGVFVDQSSWRWNMYLGTFIAAIALVCVYFSYNIEEPKDRDLQKLKLIDWPGLVALVGSLVCLLTAIDAAGSGTFDWGSPTAISLLVVGGVLLVLFIIIEAKFAKIPMIPLTLFKNRTVATVLISELFFGITFYPTYVYAPVYLQVIFRFTGLQSGFHFLPFLLGLVLAAVIAGLLMSYIGRTREISWFATSILVAGAGAMSTLDETSSDGHRIGCMLLIGAACGLCICSLLLNAQNCVKDESLSTMTALANFAQQTGGAVGISIASSVYMHTLISGLSNISGLGVSPAGLISNIETVWTLPAAIQEEAISIWGHSFKMIYYVGLASAIISWISSLFIKHYPIVQNK